MTDLEQVGEELLAQAREGRHGAAGRTVVHGDLQRATVMAMTAGSALGEHEAPPAATIQVLRGRATLHAGDEQVQLSAGQLADIPQQRHDLVADEDCVVLLTVALVDH